MKPPATNGYTALVKHIRRELQELDFIIKRRTAESYWQIGKYIHTHLLADKQRADYSTAFYIKLSRDVDRDISTLQRAVQFYRVYPNSAEQRNLSWDHYKRLITIRDPDERKKVEEAAVRHEWSTMKLGEYLNTRRRAAAPSGGDEQIPQLTFTRGRLSTFKLVEPDGQWGTQWWIDLGFRVRNNFRPGKSLRLAKDDCVEIQGSRSMKSSATDKELFTYQARVGKVIDGDTLYAVMDLHFGIVIEQKLRLRGIDCPEIDTSAGRGAKSFVEKSLKPCPWIVVKTHKDTTDKYDRYLADIFYLPGERDTQTIAREGRFLNQELLDSRLATMYA
jgi:endonuclease YncB( thermonuclease family)